MEKGNQRYSNTGFIKDDYEQPQVLLNMILENYTDDINKEQQTGIFQMINIIYEKDVYSGPIKELNSKKDLISTDRENETLNIANLIQYKGKGRPANKRYLSAIENTKRLNSKDKFAYEERKKNKRKYATYKS
ncbi:10938_t:CDS:2 [Funneliformis caledonium]|uniref:10938_t:CDS:1 n=1 Tax=Funneliformis caledonium TaxID=1117310 RepID=A0A9N8V5X0_9GLOM|nr:10938_t:CDS:2 [Funneliformis caledonium]